MVEDIDKILEIKPKSFEERTETFAQGKGIKKTSLLAKTSFISGMAIIPLEALSLIIIKTVIYNSLLESLAAILFFFCLVLLPVSVISGIAALIRISLSRKKLSGWNLAIAGIIVSILSFVVYGFLLLEDMSRHLV